MSTPYRQCIYINGDGIQCAEWFPAEDNNKLCPLHTATINPSNGDTPKQKFIDLVNETTEYVYTFRKSDGSRDVERMEAHLAKIEVEIERLKTQHYATQRVIREALAEMTEAERAERRKIKLAPQVQKPKLSKQEKMIQDFMKKYNKTEAQAREFLGVD